MEVHVVGGAGSDVLPGSHEGVEVGDSLMRVGVGDVELVGVLESVSVFSGKPRLCFAVMIYVMSPNQERQVNPSTHDINP